jgi:hypothetical protein
MLTNHERRALKRRRRRRLIVAASVLLLLVIGAVAARPTRGAIKGWQARRHAQKAFAFIEQENWSEAKNEAVAAYQLRETEPQGLRAVARFLSRVRQPQAFEFWDKLRSVQPLTRDDLREEAGAALDVGETARAEAAINELLKQTPEPADELLAAKLALQKGAAADAQPHLDGVLATPGASEQEQLEAVVLQLRSASAADQSRRDAALSRLVKLSASPTATGLQALVLRAQQALASAISDSQSVTQNPQSDVPAESARNEGEGAAGLSIRDPTVTRVKERPGFPSEMSALAQALTSHPLAQAPQKLLAIDLLIRADPAQRSALIDRAINEWKESDPASVAVLGTWLNGQGEYQRELDTIPLERAIQSRELFLQHVDALGALGRWVEIRKLLESERFPLEPVLQRMYLARCNAQLGEQTASDNNWQRALEAADNDAQKLMTLAEYAEKNGAASVAESAYAAVVRDAPRLRAAWQGRLRAVQATRDTRKIHAVLAEMLKLWPNDLAIQNDEAYLRLLLVPNDSPVGSPAPSDEKTVPANPDRTGQTASAAETTLPAVTPSPAAANTAAATPERNATDDGSRADELIAIEHLAEELVKREPSSLPHRTLLALARLRQQRPVAALAAYDNIQVAPNALSPSALAVHAAVLAGNGHRDDALAEIKQAPPDRLLPEEQAGTADLRE